MSMKHAAIVGLACAATAMLGVMGTVSGSHRDLAPGTTPDDTPETAAPELRPHNTASKAAPAPQPAPARPQRFQVASAAPLTETARAAATASPAPLVEAVKASAVAQATDCAGIQLGFALVDGTPEDVLGARKQFIHQVLDLVDPIYAHIDTIYWYLSAPDEELVTEDGDGNPQWPAEIDITSINVPPGSEDLYDFPENFPSRLIEFDEVGTYQVGIRVRLAESGVWCPPTDQEPFVPDDFEIVIDEQPSATLEVTDMIGDRDTQALVPLNDWAPLFQFEMFYPDDTPARRILTEMHYRITADPILGEREYDSYMRFGPPEEEYLLQFGMFRDFGPDGEPDAVFDGGPPLLTWNADGTTYDTTGAGDLNYDLLFDFDPADPAFSPNDWAIAGPDSSKRGYIVAVRLSSLWPSGQTLSYELLDMLMVPYFPAGDEYIVLPPPFDGEGNPVDNYPEPTAPCGGYLCEEVGYSSSFHVWDYRGPLDNSYNGYNTWNWQQFLYTPAAEFVRPRWDLPAIGLDTLTGEVLDMRKLFSIENWVPVISIDAHGECTAQPMEVNVILTDIGGNPFGPPGNGGLDPQEGLEKFTREGPRVSPISPTADSPDYAFNGVWMYYDTDTGDNCEPPNAYCPGNGVFNPPTPTGGVGVSFTDWPMIPESNGILDFYPEVSQFVEEGMMEWEYVPFPPGGGDPWWKIRLRFENGRRRTPGSSCTGAFEATPDPTNGPQADYFIVLRADSGFRDVGGQAGDGVGLFPGADTRVFIEPRRWNPLHGGHWDGGILFSNMNVQKPLPYWWLTEHFTPAQLAGYGINIGYWQDDPIYQPLFPQDTPEPWWHERDASRDTTKPIRSLVEVHDLVLTYSTSSLYAKETPIDEGQSLSKYNLSLAVSGVAVAGRFPGFPLWVDPPIWYAISPPPAPIALPPRVFTGRPPNGTGILEQRFFGGFGPTVQADLSEPANESGIRDTLTAIQYAFETVPFKLSEDAIDDQFEYPRSQYFRDPYEQPTLPRYTNWPIYYYPVDYGSQSQCYFWLPGTANLDYFADNGSPEATYADDQYIFEVLDPTPNPVTSSGVAPGMWLVDSLGARFQIAQVNPNGNANELVLVKGHAAYINQGVNVPNYPTGLAPFPAFPKIPRGPWMIVREASPRGVFPQVSDWPAGMAQRNNQPLNPEDPAQGVRAARWLKQHIEFDSQPTAMLGINLVGTDDPVVNSESPISLKSVTVAFWGPEFDRTDLAKLDASAGIISGIQLYEDSNGSGVFEGPAVFNGPTGSLTYNAGADNIVPINQDRLQWSLEPIDLDGDFQADDMSGDGVVKDSDQDPTDPEWDGLDDRAWVVQLVPETAWELPATDDGGDDLFVVVRTSETIGAFEQFRCVVPSRLPSRTPDSERIAGVELIPTAYPQRGAFMKLNPEEGPVQDFYGHDMLEVSVPVKLVDMVPGLSSPGQIQPGGQSEAVLGIDASANREANLIAEGETANSGPNTFSVGGGDITLGTDGANYYNSGAGTWLPAASGLWVVGLTFPASNVDSRVAAWQVVGVAGGTLNLRGGQPANSEPWMVVKDPTFLEQVIVEFYDVGNDGRFDLQNDFLPLNYEHPLGTPQEVSGVALYRDNDWHGGNTNGQFDPPIDTNADGVPDEYVDLPVWLDDPPVLIGTTGGEPQTQVKFVFSTPGTDDLRGREEIAYEIQPNRRQVIPQTFGSGPGDANFGPDFFVVVRASWEMTQGDDFAAAVVSWGPDTPSEVDPDNFSASIEQGDAPGQRPTEFDIFSEFPWGVRGLGFITFFQERRPLYYWNVEKRTPEAKYWTEDNTWPKVEAFTERDHSQDDIVREQPSDRVRYWIRSNPARSGATSIVTAKAAAKIDFTADRHRQVPGGDVNFTLISNTPIASVEWNFGDGNTATEENPTHQYSAPGVYTVSVTVTTQFGGERTVEKIDFIEIIDAPLADFMADPTDGHIRPDTSGQGLPPGLDVSFVDLSVGTSVWNPVQWDWNFGDGTVVTVATRPTEDEPLVHRYTEEGFYTVTLTTTFENATTSEQVTDVLQLVDYITVRECIGCQSTEGEGGGDEGEDEEIPAANFTLEDQIRDKEALMPLTDWVPLFRFTMGYDPEDPAPRLLRSMTYMVGPDPRDLDDLDYNVIGGPDATDLLEFGLFFETEGGDDEDNGTLDEFNDYLLYTWDNTGGPVATLLSDNPFGGLVYEADFIGSGTVDAPDFPIEAGPETDNGLDGYSYILAVRTSATWRSQISMSAEVFNADMILTTSGNFPINDEGEPIDSYSPNFYDDETFEPETAYSSSFTTWDISGTVTGGEAVGFFNTRNRPAYLYTPVNELTRPRWSLADTLLEAFPGEFLQMRELISLETWVPVIGINAHSTNPVHSALDFDISGLSDLRGWKDTPQMTEVNIVLTDIGGDPFGAPGNGGFNPRDGLDPISDNLWGAPIQADTAQDEDVSFNGIWVWHDTNNNGLFDPPNTSEAGGITFNGDFPLMPESMFLTYADELDLELDGGVDNINSTEDWKYVALPPGGGDPWWKIKLHFFGGRRRSSGEISDIDNTDGHLEKVPDNHIGGDFESASDYSNDFFVVVRTDSGFRDVSLGPPDGTGITMGADFRAFIEPRRFDVDTGHWEGGIYVDSMIPYKQIPDEDSIVFQWQDDSRWGLEEPWWPQRTLNWNNAKPFRVGLDVHDLVMTYASDSDYRRFSDLEIDGWGCFGYTGIGVGALTLFDRWADPLGLLQAQFANGHTVGTLQWRIYGESVTGSQGLIDALFNVDDTDAERHYPYETVPFRTVPESETELRSSVYPTPPLAPNYPDYETWPRESEPADLPHLTDWDLEYRQGRLLKQKVDINSHHTAMLGVNLAGANDPVVNQGSEMSLASMTVAFWGPDFTPDDLPELDSEGRDYNSGVMLWEDADQNGIFLIDQPFDTYYSSVPGTEPTGTEGETTSPEEDPDEELKAAKQAVVASGFDVPVPLRNLAWPSDSELIDLDGDGAPDDLNGDGAVDSNDEAWVLTFTPQDLWNLPHEDGRGFIGSFEALVGCNILEFEKMMDESSAVNALRVEMEKTAAEKALDPATLQAGDDLFVTVRTSDNPQRFERFRAVVPATLPERPDGARTAGIQFYPQFNTSPSAFVKRNPEEDPTQDFWGHDMLEVNVPVKVLDLTSATQSVEIGGPAQAVLGLDISTNREDATLAAGDSGTGANQTFTVAGAAWAADEFAGHWLVDSAYETFEITGNDQNKLQLLSGIPADGRWRVVKDPTFLEQVIVELYNEGLESEFNPLVDLLPLDSDQELSGIALYRDNDSSTESRNGRFDPAVDIPLRLDAPPQFIGQTGEEQQVKFVFSSPGTDDVPMPLADQPRRRQWVPDSFGARATDEFSGADFFIVVRPSEQMSDRDKFRIGIVGWGPNTPTEPDPDTWAVLDSEERNAFSKFQEFAWGSRALGFITFFDDPDTRYFMINGVAGQQPDNSGFGFLRSHTLVKRRTGTIVARERAISPVSVVIESASVTELPSQTLPGQQFSLVIRGQNFGANPTVILAGYDVEIDQATDTAISISISTSAGAVPEEPVVLIVRNPDTGEEATRSDLFSLTAGGVNQTPNISAVRPNKGDENAFPVEVVGTGFANRENVEVKFGRTRMPVLAVNGGGTSISVGFPASGLPDTGPLDVMVRNTAKGTEDILIGGFEYVNDAQRVKFHGWLGCAPSTVEAGNLLGDALVVFLALAGLVVAMGRTRRKTARRKG